MDGEEDWNAFLRDHPIFALPKTASPATGKRQTSLELSLSTLPEFTKVDPESDAPAPSGRRQVMVMKDSDVIVAVGSEIRMASLGDSKLSKSQRKSYKSLNVPNVNFEIHQMALNPNGKFLAVAGAFEIAVVVLPRSGFTRLVPTSVDCKSIRIGQDFHGGRDAPPIAKIDWHPWGDGGTTLMVMTVDGRLREYDIAVDTEEPQQVLSFVPEKTRKSFLAEDDAERQVASFALGKGSADWGPLSVYAVMRSGDIYAICPYMPKNASVPSSYVHALECFVAAKQEFLLQAESLSGPSSSGSLASLYENQHKYVTSLLKQLPPGTTYPSKSRTVLMHPPTTMRTQPIRQGPFLLQPAPLSLEGSDGGDATDILYLSFGTDSNDNDDDGETERLGIVLVVYKDGKVDVFLDVEKVEARWERKHGHGEELPMLAVYETVDLGLVSTLTKLSPNQRFVDLLQGSHPVFLQDPIHDETVYIYHAFGVHAIRLAQLLQNLTSALRDDISTDGGEALAGALDKVGGTIVQPILVTYSVERSSSNPVIGVAIPSDVYLTYSIFILTSAMRVVVLPLTLESDPMVKVGPPPATGSTEPKSSPAPLPTDGPAAYIPLISEEFSEPILTRPTPRPVLATPRGGNAGVLTPETMRYLGTRAESFRGQIRDIILAARAAEGRTHLQQQEFQRQQEKAREVLDRLTTLKGPRQEATKARLEQVRDGQKALMSRIDRTLNAMMRNASPELSEHERKWFEELKRMRDEVVGRGRYDQDSLVARTSQLHRELERLLPSLKELQLKEAKLRRQMLADGMSGLGVTQAFELGERASSERAKIHDIEKEVLKLATKLDVTLGKPPSQIEHGTD
ncbi:nucleoporin nup82 [Phanerochaete sordida]|uniref:Nucleoporin nup82 n=1 Tax=Phanerochaete sordida TaxID=48140 RepID=A0A9P3FXR1_9APHY|nr:nucleoporin nup82 [Phanerochaete sordida]